MVLQTILGTTAPDVTRVITTLIGTLFFLAVLFTVCLWLYYYYCVKPKPQCPSCSNEFRKGEIFCPKCGLRIGGPCPSCGNLLRGRGEYCPSCNQKLSRPL